MIPSTRARQDASTILGATPTVCQVVVPSEVSMSTRVIASVKHFLGDAPAYKVVEAVGFQCQLYAAFMANGFTQCALVGRRDFGQYAAVRTACMGADLFQIVDGFL